MIAVRIVALVLTMVVASAGCAWARASVWANAAAELGPAVVLVQQEDIPDLVRLLVDRAERAERRGDTATAAELYDAIRDLGYRVRGRGSSRTGSAEDDDRSERRGEAADPDDETDDDDLDGDGDDGSSEDDDDEDEDDGDGDDEDDGDE